MTEHVPGERNVLQRYPASSLAAVVGLVALATAAAFFIEGQERLAILIAIIGPALTTILATQRAEASTNAARRADEGVQQAAALVRDEASARAIMTPPALAALSRLVEATERAERAAVVVEKVANGNGSDHG